jgi:hypothetical protein
MTVDSKRPIAGIDATHAPSWWFYFHCGFEETSSPGIIWIICHRVLNHRSEHETSLFGKQFLVKSCIGKWHKLLQSEVPELTSSMVGETAWTILMTQPSRDIPIVSSPRKFIFYILVFSILTELINKTL